MGQVDDIADVVAFLACSESRWITGEVIGVTGGQVAGATILRIYEAVPCQPVVTADAVAISDQSSWFCHVQ